MWESQASHQNCRQLRQTRDAQTECMDVNTAHNGQLSSFNVVDTQPCGVKLAPHWGWQLAGSRIAVVMHEAICSRGFIFQRCKETRGRKNAIL